MTWRWLEQLTHRPARNPSVATGTGSLTIIVRAAIFSRGGGVGVLEIFKKRSDISILVAFLSGHFRSRWEGVQKISKIEMSDGHLL